MKQCPLCKRTYTDEQLNFCLEDGEMLSGFGQPGSTSGYADDAPPTVMLDEVRRTNPIGWPSPQQSAPPAQWQPAAPAQFGAFPMVASPNQTLAIVSLGLGIGSLTIGWCCSLGLLLSPAALITGFIALSQIKKDPSRYSGRGLAIAGIVTGVVFISFYILVMLIWGFSVFLGGIN